jgi:hypothetical protein
LTAPTLTRPHLRLTPRCHRGTGEVPPWARRSVGRGTWPARGPDEQRGSSRKQTRRPGGRPGRRCRSGMRAACQPSALPGLPRGCLSLGHAESGTRVTNPGRRLLAELPASPPLTPRSAGVGSERADSPGRCRREAKSWGPGARLVRTLVRRGPRADARDHTRPGALVGAAVRSERSGSRVGQSPITQ